MSIYRYFSRQECLKGRDVDAPLTDQMEINLITLLAAMNKLREAWGRPLIINSLYRPAGINAAAGGATGSAHLTCEAVDFADPDGSLDKWLMSNIDKLVEWGLYLEHPDSTKGWSHVMVRPTKSGVRVFRP